MDELKKKQIDEAEEIRNRKLAAEFIYDLCVALRLSQICLNTAVVYMQRFYVRYTFEEVDKYSFSTSALFVAGKFFNEYRKLEDVILCAHLLRAKIDSSLPQSLNTKSEEYALKEVEIIVIEDLLLCTLGFELEIELPQTLIVKICHLFKVSEDLQSLAYVMASVIQYSSTMCLQYSPDIIACVCIYLACECHQYRMEPMHDGIEWFSFVNQHITLNVMNDLKEKFKVILSQEPDFHEYSLPNHEEKVHFCTIAQIHDLMENSENMTVEELCAKKLSFVGIVQKVDIAQAKIIYFLKDGTGPGIEIHAGIRECAENNRMKIYSKNKHVRMMANIRSIDGQNCVAAFNIQEEPVNISIPKQNASAVNHPSMILKRKQASTSALSSIENVVPSSSKRRKLIS